MVSILGRALILGSFLFAGTALAKPIDDELINAAATGEIETVSRLLSKGANPNFLNEHGDTALTFLVPQMIGFNDDRQIETIKLLLDHGADINERNGEGQTALMIAAGNGGNVTQSDGQIAAVKLLLDRHADVNAANKAQSITALHWAAFRGYLVSMQMLLDHGADKTLRNSYGETPVMMMEQNPGLSEETRKKVRKILSK